MEKNACLKPHWLEIVLLALPFIALAILWPRLPERVPSHWGWHGEVDGWTSPVGTLFLPLINILVYLLVTFLPILDPRMRRSDTPTQGNLTALHIIRLSTTAFLAFLFVMQMIAALRPQSHSGILIINGFLVSFLIMGNFLGNLKPNRFVGIRTPWTLKSDETWRATHRNAGQLTVFGCLILLGLQFFVPNIVPAAIVGTVILCLWTLYYSWHHYRSHTP